MMTTRFFSARHKAIVCACALLLTGSAVGARSATAEVAIGEIDARAASGDKELAKLFEKSVAQELSRLDLSHAKSKDRYLLSATLVSVGTRRARAGESAKAEVSAILRRARGGELHAVLRGSASTAEASEDARRAVVRGAVRSALRRVPEALR
ncbi:MAG: hypothetical protein R3B13_38805 [Polyangiaceae bacterium]